MYNVCKKRKKPNLKKGKQKIKENKEKKKENKWKEKIMQRDKSWSNVLVTACLFLGAWCLAARQYVILRDSGY